MADEKKEEPRLVGWQADLLARIEGAAWSKPLLVVTGGMCGRSYFIAQATKLHKNWHMTYDTSSVNKVCKMWQQVMMDRDVFLIDGEERHNELLCAVEYLAIKGEVAAWAYNAQNFTYSIHTVRRGTPHAVVLFLTDKPAGLDATKWDVIVLSAAQRKECM